MKLLLIATLALAVLPSAYAEDRGKLVLEAGKWHAFNGKPWATVVIAEPTPPACR